MSDTVIINGQEILPDQNVQINLNIAKLPTNTMIDLPVFVFRRRKKGYRLLIMAGIYGELLLRTSTKIFMNSGY